MSSLVTMIMRAVQFGKLTNNPNEGNKEEEDEEETGDNKEARVKILDDSVSPSIDNERSGIIVPAIVDLLSSLTRSIANNNKNNNNNVNNNNNNEDTVKQKDFVIPLVFILLSDTLFVSRKATDGPYLLMVCPYSSHFLLKLYRKL